MGKLKIQIKFWSESRLASLWSEVVGAVTLRMTCWGTSGLAEGEGETAVVAAVATLFSQNLAGP